MSAATLNCPSCGAAVSQDSPQCQYCRSLLQTVACPSCFGLMFLGTKFCPHCGTRAEQLKSDDASSAESHHCPRCQTGLTAIAVAETPMEECGHCGGLWISSARFEQICNDREAQSAAIGMNVPPPLPHTEGQVFYLKCPACAKIMNRMNYAHSSGIIIDICRPHGIWFDRDELRRIIEFIRAGGLDRARQREKQDIEQQRRRLESQDSWSSVGNLGTGGTMSDDQWRVRDNDAVDVMRGIGAIIRAVAWFFR